MAERNPHAEHGDARVQALREQYGDLADRTVDELQQHAQEKGVTSPSGMNKEELLRALSENR